MAEPIVQAENLTKRFGDFVAVDQVSFSVEPGEIVGYLGPNGSGKTTTIRMLLGLLTPSAGQARVMGLAVDRHAEAIRARVGYMSQKFALYDELTAWENLAFYGGVYGITDPQRLHETLAQLKLESIAREPAGALPIGWRQRLALATAIIHRPKLLFLDEPTSGVDPLARRSFWDLIYELSESGVTAFVTTHYMDEAEYCTRVGIMRRGKLLMMDTPTQVKRRAFSGRGWDVHATPVLEALDALQQLPFVRRAGLAGDHLRAVTDDRHTLEDLERGLRAQGVATARVEAIEPTLEDVFLALAED